MAALAVTLAATGSGCSSASGDGDAVDLGGPSPLAAHLGLLDLSDPESRAQEIERRRAAEADVVACMADQGFTYIPPDINLPEPGLTGEPGTEGTAEWVATWGFGLTTRWFPEDQVGPDLLGFPPQETPTTPTDPNIEIVADLEPADQERYRVALFGGNDDRPADDATEPGDPGPTQEPVGCQGLAARANLNPFYQDFAAELQELNESIAADPAFEEFDAEVASCMADRGFTDYVDLATAQSELEARLLALDAAVEALPRPELTIEDLAAMSEMSEEELAEFTAEPPAAELDDETRSRLADLQADELSLALAVGECGGGELAEERLRREVRARYEEAFIADFEDRLEDYRR